MLVERRRIVLGRLSIEEVFVGDHRVEVGCGDFVCQHDVLSDRIERVCVVLAFLHQLRIDEQDFVGGVVDDVLEVLVGKPHV